MESEIRLLSSSEGARIGCKLSSFAFALTVQDLYETIRSTASHADERSCIKAATDDIVVVLKPTLTNEKHLYYHIREVCTVLEEEARKVGLSFTNDKAQVLLPKTGRPNLSYCLQVLLFSPTLQMIRN